MHERVLEQYTALLSKRAAALQVGDPNRAQVHLGPMINQHQTDRAMRIVTESIAQGAKVETGAKADGYW